MLDDSWVRVQVYMPERVRYVLRSHAPAGVSDSNLIRKILYWITDIDNSEFLEDILK